MNQTTKDRIEIYFQQKNYPAILELLNDYSSHHPYDRDL